MKDKSKLTAIVLVIITIFVVILSLVTEKEEKEVVESKILIVNNYSEFYTVNSCLYRTITYIAENDYDNLMLLLTEDFKQTNKITENDVLDLFIEVELGSTFVSEKMYYEKFGEGLTKYYVSGHIELNKIIDDEIISREENEQVYFIVYLDSNNNLFSIEPYDGKIFKEGDINEE